MGDSYVTLGAMMTCTFGMAPSSLVVLPARTKMLSNVPRANIMDYAPMVNIMPFGMCNTLSNPTVASATAAAMGVLTPMPCIPAITAPWMPGNPQCLIQGQPALTRNSQCICMWGGVIKFTTDGQMPGVPPVITPDVSVDVTITPPLTPIQRQQMEPWEQQQYDRELATAKHAGANDLAISADLDHMAEKYEVSGDTAKAAKAREASQAYRESAAKKQSDAIARLNNKYLPGNDKNVNTATEQKAPSKQELQEIYKQSTDDQSKQDREIEDLDKQLEKNSEEFGKNDKKLKEANQKLTEAATPYQEAHKERQAATEKREQADKELNAARQREEMANNGGSEFAKQYAKEQRKQAEANARQAAKEEETAKAKEAKAEKKLDTARKEQQAAADKWRGSLDQYNDLSKQKETAEKKRDESTRRAQAAQTALNAQEEMEKQDEAVSKHRENVDATKEKRLQMDDYSQQQKKAQAEADAWEDLGVNAYINSGSNMGDKFFANADKYKEQANQAGKKKEEARKEWEHSKENLKQTYQDAYSEDALFDAYTAKVDYDKSMAELNKGTQ